MAWLTPRYSADTEVLPMGKGKGPSRVVLAPLSDDRHVVVFFKRHVADDPRESAPGYEFLSACPMKVQATMFAVLKAVAAAPPKRYAGGGYWEAMHGTMTGWFEVRVDGSRPRLHYRVFCRLDYSAKGADRPLLVVVTGMSKPRARRRSQRATTPLSESSVTSISPATPGHISSANLVELSGGEHRFGDPLAFLIRHWFQSHPHAEGGG
jgi:hypothetical protein